MTHLISCTCRLLLLWVLLMPATVAMAGEEADNRVSLPSSVELDKLTDLVAQTLGLSVQFGAGKIAGTVRVTLAGPVGGHDLWSIYHQLLANGGFTTVVTGLPPVYQVVSMTDAPLFSRTLTADELAQIPYPPGYQVLLYELKYVSSETTMKLLTAIFTSPGVQIRSLGGDGRRLLFAAPGVRQGEASVIMRALDQPGRQPTVRLVKPERTTPLALQASVTAAWNALGRIDESPHQAEILVAPDGLQLLLVATATDLVALEAVVHELDRTEPVETRTYRPRYFALDEVANLITQTTGTGPTPQVGTAATASAPPSVEIIRDNLTGSLIIRATAAEHERITALVKSLDDAPATTRRQARTIQVKHRRADEISRMVLALISSDTSTSGGGSNGAMVGQPQTPQARPQPSATTGMATPQSGFGPSQSGSFSNPGGMLSGGGGMGGSMQPMLPTQAPTAQATISGTPDGSLLITSDPVTNRLLVLGEPRIIDQVQALVIQLDQYQPQVDVEFTMVSLTDEQSRDIGVELVRQFKDGATTTTLSSLFGLSSGDATDAATRAIGNAAGFGSVILRPGDYAAVIRALETVNEGRSVIRSQLVVNNNAQASLNGVIQQPISSLNSSTQVATTSFAGTSDAGTQITISPQISPTDYVTLSYSLSQSSFLGQPIVNDSGVIPPTKRNDNVASTATVPDGHVIALGGLSNHSTGRSESRIPLLGSIPYLGALFRSRSDSTNESRFYVFIRVTVLRRSNFADLRYVSEERAKSAGIAGEGEPQLEPQFIR